MNNLAKTAPTKYSVLATRQEALRELGLRWTLAQDECAETGESATFMELDRLMARIWPHLTHGEREVFFHSAGFPGGVH